MRCVIPLLLIGTLTSLASCHSSSHDQRATDAAPSPTSEETCTAQFTPYSKEAGHCSADHTVCKKDADGREACHGGAIIIPCGETGERCGKTFYCECGAASGGRKNDGH